MHELMSLPAHHRYRLLADRFRAHRLWAHEDLFAEVFTDAVDLIHVRGTKLPDAQRFIDYTFINLITRPGDLVALCRRIPTDGLRLTVVEAYVRHPLTPHDIVIAMGASREVYQELPAGGWTEQPMYLHATARLNAEPTRRFDLHELFPFGTEHDRSAARSALHTALATDQLTDQAKAAALNPGRAELPPPTFHDGQHVQVVLNDHNRTPHLGTIRTKVWHYKDQRWYFFLRDDTGRKISKRYAAADLQAAP
jgi:hypothetical protein